jgi:cytochrome c oxidase subunit 4
MSTHTVTPAHPHGEHAHPIAVKTLLVIYGCLIGLMFLTYIMAKFDLGRANFLIAMGIATVKMTLIILYFMHVRFGERLIWVASTAAFLWLLIFIGGVLNDYWTRDYLINVPGK